MEGTAHSTVSCIIEKWRALQRHVAKNNKEGFLDLARYCEDIIGKTFNILRGLQLVNLNRQISRVPLIDLADEDRGVYIQVTTLQSNQKEKVTETATRFAQKYAGKSLTIFFVFAKPGWDSAAFIPGTITVLDSADLLDEIQKATVEQQEAILALLRRTEDVTLPCTSAANLLEDDRDLHIPETCLDMDGHASYFACGLGRVRLDAYIPTSYEESLSCAFYFSKRDISAAVPSLSGPELPHLLFHHREKGLSPDRPFIGFISPEHDLVRLHLGSATLHVDIHTATQVCRLIDRLYAAYMVRKRRILSILGCHDMRVEPSDRIPVLQLSKDIWSDMFQFANHHSVHSKSDQWDCFIPYNDSVRQGRIQVSASGRELLFCLSKQEEPGDTVIVSWEPGHIHGSSAMAGFDNRHKWKLDYSLQWIEKEWLPLLCRQRYACVSHPRRMMDKLFGKRLPYPAFYRWYMRGVQTLLNDTAVEAEPSL